MKKTMLPQLCVTLKKDEIIIKYAEAIASASCDISTGEWVHIHNTAGIRGRGDKE